MGNLTHKRTINFGEISFGSSSSTSIIASLNDIEFNDYSSTAEGLYYKLDFEYAIDPTISLLFGYKTGNLEGYTDYTTDRISSTEVPSSYSNFFSFTRLGIGWSVNVEIYEILIGASYKLSDTSKLRFGIQNLTYKVSYPDSLATFDVFTFIETILSPDFSSSRLTKSGINLASINDPETQLDILILTSNSNTYEDKRTAIFIGYTKDFNF